MNLLPAHLKGNKGMSDKVEGVAADAGATAQRKLDQAAEAQDQLVQFIKDNPISAALIFFGIGSLMSGVMRTNHAEVSDL
jgi:hypothetical protein